MFAKYFIPAFAAASIVAAGGAASTCTDWLIVPNTAELVTQCRSNQGVPLANQVSIGNCVGNGNGFPGCQFNGEAGSSCIMTDLVATSSEVTVTMSCKADDGSTRVTTGFDIGK